MINYLSQGSIAALQSGGMHVVISDTGGWGPFTMAVDQKPFDDVRVRQALRLVVDRQEMLDQVFGGKGKIGNDVFGIFDKDFPTDLPQRVQDIDQAKSLLKSAGQENLVIQLVTTPNAPGMIPAAPGVRHAGQEGGGDRQHRAADHHRLLRELVSEGRIQPGLLADPAVPACGGPGARRAGRPVQRHSLQRPRIQRALRSGDRGARRKASAPTSSTDWRTWITTAAPTSFPTSSRRWMPPSRMSVVSTSRQLASVPVATTSPTSGSHRTVGHKSGSTGFPPELPDSAYQCVLDRHSSSGNREGMRRQNEGRTSLEPSVRPHGWQVSIA